MRFIDNKDGTITDNITSLIWQQADDKVRRTWQEAIKFATSLGGGWRLPTVDELFYLADKTKYTPSIDPIFQCHSDYYWTSSTHAYYPEDAWYVVFMNGDASWDNKELKYFSRYVQGN